MAAPALVLLWPSAPMAVRGAAALALLWMPVWLMVRHLLPDERDPALGLVLRLCGATAFHCILLLWLAPVLAAGGAPLLTGQLSELTARLSFALAGLAVVIGGMALAHRLVGRGLAPLVAGFVLALDGLLIAFARIVQYQSLVLLLSLGAYWCCWRFARGAPGSWRYLNLTALFIAVALLGHWDAIYDLAVLPWLVVVGVRRRRWGLARTAP